MSDTSADQQAFNEGTQVAQIFSGIFFSGLAAWLVVTNGTSLAYVQKAALEKRLTTCCFLNIYVAFFSTFFNIFQLTKLDDAVLPTSTNFTLDLCRPIEWIMTCPIMQLSLVLMGGGKIPEYRRFMMPGFSIFLLGCGTASTFVASVAGKCIVYGIGCIVFGVMVYFLRQQIVEYSSGAEGLIHGDSEFRKATLLLIATWLPFPTWYFLSPEGFDIVQNVLLIHVGWAFLNILAKFTFIFYVQRVKDMYCNRLKTKRELVGHKGAAGHLGRHGSTSPPDMEFRGALPDYETALEYEEIEKERKKEKLSAVVVETMTFLGMAQHTDRFLGLLGRANLHTVEEVEELTKEQSVELQLPYDLVSAVQRRLRVWKLEMVDDAEAGLERGEEHYIKKGLELPRLDPLQEAGLQQQPMSMPNMVPYQVMPHSAITPPFEPAMYAAGVASPVGQDVIDSRAVASLEEMLQKTEAKILDGQKSGGQGWEKALEVLTGSFQETFLAMEKRLCSQIHQQLEATSKTSEQRGELRAFESRQNVKLEELAKSTEHRHEIHAFERRLNQQIEQQVAMLSTKIEVCCQKVEACGQKVETCGQKVDACSMKVDTCNERADICAHKVDKCNSSIGDCSAALLGQQGESVAKLVGKLEELSGKTRSGHDSLLQRMEGLQTGQAKLASESENGWRERFTELENTMTCRDDEQEANQKRRFEELIRLSAAKRLDELAAQVQRVGDRSEAAVESFGTGLQAELQSTAQRVTAKTEGLLAAAQRNHAEFEKGLQQRFAEVAQAVAQSAQQAALGAKETAQRAEKAVEALDGALQKHVEEAVVQAVAQGAQQGAAQAAQRAEKAVEVLEAGLQKRLEDAMARAMAEGAHQGAAHMAHRTEKAIESLESGRRAEMHAAMNNIVERVDDVQGTQMRKAGERDERNMRRMEELLELTTIRSVQKVEDVGLELKKEIHGFAKRLNSKIPFM